MAGLREIAGRHRDSVVDVRGKGLMIGVEFDTPARAEEVQFAAFQRGLPVLEAGRKAVRLSPPLVVSESEVETALRILEQAIDDASRHPDAVAAQAEGAGALHEVEAGG
jgi:4-aminobutyrate aminotransferase-like enzyme